MKTKFQSFLNEKSISDFIQIQEIGKILTIDLIPELSILILNKEDIDLFQKSSNQKTHFEIKLRYQTEYEYNDIHQILKSCDFIYNIYSLISESDEVQPFWIDMGNGFTTLALEYGEYNYSIFKIYSGESRFDDFLRKLEENIELEISANKYNL